jgi:serine/threonine protein kinase
MILGKLGRGARGVVYKARQAKPNRVVALKMVLSGAHAGAEELARFRAEAEALAQLQHPNIVPVYEVGECDGLPFFSMEYCPGGSLGQKLALGPLPPGEVAGLVEVLALAVQAAHRKRIIHRDLKPANVLLSEDGTPKIADFGLAKNLDEAGLTATGVVLGTPSYMAPEQAEGRVKDVAQTTDVYALGAILYECLTGRPPFRGATARNTLAQVCSQEPILLSRLRPEVPRDLETVCLKCLEKEPGQRYQTAGELANDLRCFAEGRPITARLSGLFERSVKWARRRPTLFALIILSLFVLIENLIILPFFMVKSAAGGTPVKERGFADAFHDWFWKQLHTLPPVASDIAKSALYLGSQVVLAWCLYVLLRAFVLRWSAVLPGGQTVRGRRRWSGYLLLACGVVGFAVITWVAFKAHRGVADVVVVGLSGAGALWFLWRAIWGLATKPAGD